MFFWGRGFKSHIHHNKTFLDFPPVELEKYSPRYPQEMNRLDIDRSAREPGQPAIPPFQGGRVLQGLSLGALLVKLLQVVKLTNPL